MYSKHDGDRATQKQIMKLWIPIRREIVKLKAIKNALGGSELTTTRSVNIDNSHTIINNNCCCHHGDHNKVEDEQPKVDEEEFIPPPPPQTTEERLSAILEDEGLPEEVREALVQSLLDAIEEKKALPDDDKHISDADDAGYASPSYSREEVRDRWADRDIPPVRPMMSRRGNAQQRRVSFADASQKRVGISHPPTVGVRTHPYDLSM